MVWSVHRTHVLPLLHMVRSGAAWQVLLPYRYGDALGMGNRKTEVTPACALLPPACALLPPACALPYRRDCTLS